MTPTKYIMSFTAGALLYHESVKLAELYSSCRQWDEVKRMAITENVIQARAISTLQRITSEIIARLKNLSLQEITFITTSGYTEQKYVLWLAVCRRYKFIADFVVDIVYNNFVSLKTTVTYDDYNAFFNNKAEWHSEVDAVTTSTRQKLRNTLFQMLREAGLLDKKNTIIPLLPSPAFQSVLSAMAERERLFFPLSELARKAK